MKRVMVYFDFFGRKLKTEMNVYNENDECEVVDKLSERIKVIKVDVLGHSPEEKQNSTDEGERLFNQLLGRFKR